MQNLEKISKSDGADRRDTERREILRASTVRGAEGVPVDVTVRDLSQNGFAVELDIPLPLNSLVQIGLPGVGSVGAHVRRANGRLYGCELVAPLSAAQLASAFATETVVRGSFSALLVPAPFAEPEIGKWPGAVRVGIIIGSTGLLWAAIWALL